MSFFSTASPADSSIEEGTVVQVDAARSLCKVKTIRGQLLPDVQWTMPSGGSSRGSDRTYPVMGDRVVLGFGLGYPIITGFLPRLQVEGGTNPLSIGAGTSSVDPGAYGPGGYGAVSDQNKPKDVVGGDRVLSSMGGAMMALLRGGAALIRSNKGTEIFFHGMSGMIRVVSRNWTHFTDLSTDVIRNFKGRAYRYTGYSKAMDKSKAGEYNLHFYYGDVAAAEAVKGDYDTYSGSPASDNVIYKEQVTRVSDGLKLRERTYNELGEESLKIKNDSHFTKNTTTAEQVSITWNDENTIVLTEQSIHVHHKDGADVILDGDGIRVTFEGGSIDLSASSINLQYESNTVTLSSGNITSTSGAGSSLVSSSETRLTNSGHQVSITASGVNIT